MSISRRHVLEDTDSDDSCGNCASTENDNTHIKINKSSTRYSEKTLRRVEQNDDTLTTLSIGVIIMPRRSGKGAFARDVAVHYFLNLVHPSHRIHI